MSPSYEPGGDGSPGGADSNHALTCSICLELFRCPIALPTCGHCFDKDCLLRSASAAASTSSPPRRSGLLIDAGAAGGALPELKIPQTAPCPLCRQPFDPLAAAEAHPVCAIVDLAAAAAAAAAADGRGTSTGTDAKAARSPGTAMPSYTLRDISQAALRARRERTGRHRRVRRCCAGLAHIGSATAAMLILAAVFGALASVASVMSSVVVDSVALDWFFTLMFGGLEQAALRFISGALLGGVGNVSDVQQQLQQKHNERMNREYDARPP